MRWSLQCPGFLELCKKKAEEEDDIPEEETEEELAIVRLVLLAHSRLSLTMGW